MMQNLFLGPAKLLHKARARLFLASHGKGLIVCKRRYGGQDLKLFVDGKDEGLSMQICLYGSREKRALEEYAKRLKPGFAVAEIGANIGYYTVLESKILGKKGVVYAIEPVEANVELLKKNLALNKAKNAKVFKLAIGPKKGVSRIAVPEKRNTASFCTGGKTGERVDMVTLDSFLKGKKSPDMIKVDVEGYEYEMLKGMRKTLEKKPGLFIEVHQRILGKKRTKEFFESLKKYGYGTALVVSEINEKYKLFLPFISLFQKLFSKKGFPPEFGFEIGVDEMVEKLFLFPDKYHVFFEGGCKK